VTEPSSSSSPHPDLAAAFARAADAEQESEKKTRLRAVADGLAGVARDIAVGVITKKIGDV
jgi:hypothetical protein